MAQLIMDHPASGCFGTSLAPRLLLLLRLTALDFGCFGRCSLSPTPLTQTLVHPGTPLLPPRSCARSNIVKNRQTQNTSGWAHILRCQKSLRSWLA